MPSSPNVPSSVLSQNDLQNLLRNEIADTDQSQALERLWIKVRMANHLRMMQDNQRVLDTSVAEDRAVRAQRHRMREYQMDRMGVPGNTTLEFPKEDEMGDIKIDSPDTHNHYYPQPPCAPGKAPWIAAGLATVVAAALGGSLLGGLWNKPPPPAAPVNTTVEKTEGFRLRLVPPEKAP